MKTFGWDSTTDEVLEGVDLTGKRALVTGVSAGLGVETARVLAAQEAEVVGAARDLAKARTATQAIGEAHPDRLSLIELDLASLASVRAAADALLGDSRPLDLVITNAGVMATPFGRTADGFETQLGVNHLGHFVLVNRLAPLMRAGARLVVLSSIGHQFGDIDLEDPNFQRTPYDSFAAYGAAKTANALFAVEFDRRHKARGVRAAAVHPGGIITELARHMTEDSIQRMMALTRPQAGETPAGRGFKTVAQGAATTVWAATAPADLVGGRYCEDCHVAELATTATTRGVRPYALDPEHARAVWAVSEALVGERF